MGRKSILFLLFFAAFILLLILIMQPLSVIEFQKYISILFPKGIVALEERNLLFLIQGLMLLVIIPVYILTFIFSWRYSVHNPKAKYDPDLVDNKIAEYIWWGLPLVMTLLVGIVTWYKTYQLDPYKPIASPKKEITIQVVALQWRWLFIYPEEKIATVNYFQIPVDHPVHFEITADAPMNSFWIPHLGGQIYAMPAMKTELYLIANEAGEFRGSSANLSGEGFAAMSFMTKASSEEDYQAWIKSVQASPQVLDFAGYQQLALPSKDSRALTYQLKDDQLFNEVLHKFMHPQGK